MAVESVQDLRFADVEYAQSPTSSSASTPAASCVQLCSLVFAPRLVAINRDQQSVHRLARVQMKRPLGTSILLADVVLGPASIP